MNFLDRNEIERIITDLDVRAISDLYLKSPDVHSFTIEDIEEKGRLILLHVNHHAQHTLTIIEDGGTTAGTHYTNYRERQTLGELLGHELHSMLDLFLSPYNGDEDRQRGMIKPLAHDLLDGGVKYVGFYALFEAVAHAAVPVLSVKQIALSLLAKQESEYSDEETGEEPEPNVQYSPAPDIEIRSLSQEGNAIANSLIAKSIACVRFLDVASSTVDNTPSVVVAFLDQTNAVVIIERVAEVEIHFLDSVRHKDGTRANNIWGPLLEFIAGTPETHRLTAAVLSYIRGSQQTGTLKQGDV